MSKNVFLIGESLEGKRPNFPVDRPDGAWDVAINARVSEGRPGCPASGWVVPDLIMTHKGSTPIEDWDYYGHCFGVFSPRAMEVLAPYFGEGFEPLKVRLEGHLYFTLRCRLRIDCLHKSASKILYFDRARKEVMQIDQYAFHKEMLADPIIFAIPQLVFHLFCTESIARIIANAKLRGFKLKLVDGTKRTKDGTKGKRKKTGEE